MAGQGVNLGFGDAAALATVIVEGLESGEDIGSLQLLRQYQNDRKASNMFMMAGIEGLKRLFDSSFLPIALARNVGLSLTNAITPLKVSGILFIIILIHYKHQIVRYATGSQIDVSKIGNKPKQ
jgi:2-polyprenyl-6-methoxyphenol hydroxylase-like FAD-dependent oxidoreductase